MCARSMKLSYVRRLGPVFRRAFELTYVQMEVPQVRKMIRYVQAAAHPANEVQGGAKCHFTQYEHVQGRKGKSTNACCLRPPWARHSGVRPRRKPECSHLHSDSKPNLKLNARALGTEDTTSFPTNFLKRSSALRLKVPSVLERLVRS